MFSFRKYYEKEDKVTINGVKTLNKCSECKKYITPKIQTYTPQHNKHTPKNTHRSVIIYISLHKITHSVIYIDTDTKMNYTVEYHILHYLLITTITMLKTPIPHDESPINPHNEKPHIPTQKNQKPTKLHRATPPICF